jgi:hypothetical protein
MQHGISAAALLPLFRSGGAFHDHLIVSFAAISRTVTAITATDANSPISDRNTRPARPPPKVKAMSLRAGLQTWTRVAALLAAAAIVLATPYGVAVAMRSGLFSIISIIL